MESDETLAEAFWSVTRTLRLATHAAVAPLGLTPGQARALATLTRHGRMRLSELSERLHIAPRSTTEVVDALETDGLVAREPDETDRRATLVALTEHGADVGRQLSEARAAEAEAFFGRLDDHDRAELRRILEALRG
jgi:DNA-binding MarR family transcriptional regulator